MTSSVTPITNPNPSFAAGEISPLLYGRTDYQRYDEALAKCLNFVVRPLGGLTRRPPTEFVRTAYAASVLVPFEFSRGDSSMLELGDETVRFFRDGGLVLDGGDPYEVTMPFLTADLFDVRKIYSGDVIYLSHPSRVNVQTLSRYGDLDWRLADHDMQNGPFLDPNTDAAVTVKASAATGNNITLTASGFTFEPGHVGVLWKIALDQETPGIVGITAVAGDGETATADVLADVPSSAVDPTTTQFWAEGAFSTFRGFPSAMVIHQQRLVLGKETFVYGSALGGYNDFGINSLPNGAFRERIGSGTQRSNDVTWFSSDLTLLIGTVGEEFSMSASSLNEAITALNLKIDPATTEGSIPLDPIRTGGHTLFVSKNKRRVMSIHYDVQARAWLPKDLTLIAEHITKSGIKRWAWQRDPLRVLWGVTEDGRLIGFTYNTEAGIAAWHQHDVGGFVEDVAVIPAASGADDEVYLIVRRTLLSGEHRNVERMLRYSDPSTDVGAAAVPFLDCQISTESETDINVVTDLDIFEGMQVGVLVDGSYYPDQLVQLGLINLPKPGRKVTVGLPARSHARLLPSSAVLRDGPTEGRMRRVTGVAIRYHGGPGGLIGNLDNFEHMEAVGGWTGEMDVAPQAKKAELEVVPVEGEWQLDDFIDIVVDGPFVFDILSAPRLIEIAGA